MVQALLLGQIGNEARCRGPPQPTPARGRRAVWKRRLRPSSLLAKARRPTLVPVASRTAEWREDLKSLYRAAGVAARPLIFLLDETQILEETFLEDVNNILTSGEVPNLFPKVPRAGRWDLSHLDGPSDACICSGAGGWQTGHAP
jgi:hypothetical protein